MDIIFHIGAHRTGTTTFQHYMRDHTAELAKQGIGFWGPHRTRKSLFPGLFPDAGIGLRETNARRATGRIRMQVQRAAETGTRQLLISDENVMGTSRHNLRSCALYPAIGERMARLGAAFQGHIARVILSVRSQDHWWASAAAMTVGRGHMVPAPARLELIASEPRSWRDVITDLACAMPEVDIRVMPFEHHIGRPQNILHQATDGPAPQDSASRWLNRSPDLERLRRLMEMQGGDVEAIPQGHGRWQPFSTEQCAQLREAYADDMHWLMAGADGLATLITQPTRTQTGQNLHSGDLTEGNGHELGQTELARPG